MLDPSSFSPTQPILVHISLSLFLHKYSQPPSPLLLPISAIKKLNLKATEVLVSSPARDYDFDFIGGRSTSLYSSLPSSPNCFSDYYLSAPTSPSKFSKFVSMLIIASRLMLAENRRNHCFRQHRRRWRCRRRGREHQAPQLRR